MNFLNQAPLLLFFILARLLLTLYSLAFINFWYWRIFYFDSFMHFLGGFLVALISLWYFWPKNKTKKNFNEIINLGIISALGIGLLWEFLEIGFDQYFSAKIGLKSLGVLNHGLEDSASDLLFDILGGFSASLYFYGLGNVFSFIRKVLNLKNE